MKIFRTITVACCVTFALYACKKEDTTVHQLPKMETGTSLKNTVVVNAEDPICKMKTAEFLEDTAIYKGKTYGFCSTSCKTEFKKNPESYLK